MAKRAAHTLVDICQTRIELAVIELENEKANLIRLLILSGLCLLFTLFALLSGLMLLSWSVTPVNRFTVFSIATGLLIILAIGCGGWAWYKARQTSLLRESRQQLKEDLQALGVRDE